MIDRIKLQNKLIDGFINYEYQRTLPEMTPVDFTKAINVYRRDPCFHARVHQLTDGVLCIIDECEAAK